MTAYQDRAQERIKGNVSKMRSYCKQGKKTNMGEADTRSNIIHPVLVDCLGWDEFEDITEEERVKGGFCDILLKHEGKPYAIIEAKKVSGGLTDQHVEQARHYAQDKGLDWVVLTNGDEWRVYKLNYHKKKGQNPEPYLFHLFTTSFVDTTIKPADRVELLYLLSKEAAKHDELELYYNKLHALSPQELTKRLLRKDVIDRVRIGIKNDIDYRIDNEELAKRITEIIDDNALPPNLSYYINKLG